MNNIAADNISVGIHYKDSNNRFNMGIATYYKDNHTLGIKPSVSYNNIQLSLPITLIKNMTYGKIPLAISSSIMCIVGLIFYMWSDEDDADNSVYSNECIRYNDSMRYMTFNTILSYDLYSIYDRLLILDGWIYDSSMYRTVYNELYKIYNHIKDKYDSSSIVNYVNTSYNNKILYNNAMNISYILNNNIILNTVSYSIDNTHVNRINNKSTTYSTVIYILYNTVHISNHVHTISIGRY